VEGRVALVGDAAGSVDAISGAGMTLGLHQALLVAEALERGELRAYERAHRRLVRVTERMTALLLALNHRPRLRRAALRVLAAAPWLLTQLVELHVRAHPLSGTGALGAPAWRLAPGAGVRAG
jgi:flavin-dependent dehydrogenase